MPKPQPRKTTKPASKPVVKKTIVNPDRVITTHEAGWYIQVNPSSINKWVKEGRITAFRTPGGHRRITVGNFIAFLEKHDMPVSDALRNGVEAPRMPKGQNRSQKRAA